MGCGCGKNKTKKNKSLANQNKKTCSVSIISLKALKPRLSFILSIKEDLVFNRIENKVDKWILNYDKSCPDEFEYNHYKELVDGEYKRLRR